MVFEQLKAAIGGGVGLTRSTESFDGSGPFLHGTLRLQIESAERSSHLLSHKHKLYVIVKIGFRMLVRTAVVEDRSSFVFNSKYIINVADQGEDIIFQLREEELGDDDVFSTAKIKVDDLIAAKQLSGEYPLEGSRIGRSGTIKLHLEYTPVSEQNLASPDVPHTYFPPRPGCRVRLYQDAVQPQDTLPPIKIATGMYQHESAWIDLQTAIEDAQQFIYLTGWSVNAAIHLVRPDGPSIGEVLKQKADAGVVVNMMLWDDMTSTAFGNAGLMGTHDNETYRFFKGSKVNCRLTPKPGDASNKLVSAGVESMFTHHQKTVILDTHGGPGGKRRVIAFVGGLDITDGRYGDAKHSLFRRLNTYHKGDFYNNCVEKVTEETGPQETWHDIHSRLEGRIARDVLQNFEERWHKQCPDDADLLIKLNPEAIAASESDEVIMDESDAETWHVQLFRSIDSHAAVFDPAVSAPPVYKRGQVSVDRSIQDAYVYQIRRAKQFLYIENQYFLGSSHLWSEPTDLCSHLIPIEITERIVRGIKSGHRFTAYVAIPMYPEGLPTSGSVQEILHFQTLTMEMMYTRIAAALQSVGLDHHPSEYLNFFCLGNRETTAGAPPLSLDGIDPSTPLYKALENRRLQIYIHSKMLIIDDEYIIIGSANINQRSMSGLRDSEIAMGAYQSRMLADSSVTPAADVRAFRVSLWAEHLGTLEPIFISANHPDCVHRVNKLAEANWAAYAGPQVVDLPGHLLKYPLAVAKDGSVTPLAEYPEVPDLGGAFVGAKSVIPNIMTT